MGSELRPLISEVQQERFSIDTNRIYNAGYSEIREPNWGLRNRISGWSERVRELTRPNNYSVIEGSDIELPITTEDEVHIPMAPLLNKLVVSVASDIFTLKLVS